MNEEHKAFFNFYVARLLRVVFNFHWAKLLRVAYRMHILPGMNAYVEVARL